MPSNVILQSRAYHTDGETRLLDPNNPVSEEQMGMLQKDQSFEMRIMLNL